ANSGVVRGVTFEGASTKGVWRPTDGQALTDSLLTAVATGGIYLNVHTTANPAGEIRGQLELAGGIGRAVEMDPQSEGGDITSDGHGTASATLTGAGMVFHATVSELTGPIQAAHFHQAPLGTNGGVVRPVTFDGQNLAGIWRAVDADPLDASKMVAFFADELYLNVHTQSNPGGEVRGQLDRVENVATTAAEPVGEGVPGAFALDQNYPNPFNPSTTIRFDLRESGHATLEVFDVLGRRVALLHDGPLAAGSYSVQFDGSRFASGVYAYRLTAGDQHITRSMQLAK
ncbi:MAG TPA: CHRD domain-containing protein, partial [Rhodothermales bacterium]